MKVVYPVEDFCVQCYLCQVACVVEHSRSKDVIKAYFLEKLRFTERCRVHSKGPVSISIMCRHCSEPECMEACKNGSIVKDKSGRVMVNEEKCVSCWMCIMACPYGVIKKMNDVPRGIYHPVSLKCDLCPESEVPACVRACPNRALVFEDRGERENDIHPRW